MIKCSYKLLYFKIYECLKNTEGMVGLYEVYIKLRINRYFRYYM